MKGAEKHAIRDGIVGVENDDDCQLDPIGGAHSKRKQLSPPRPKIFLKFKIDRETEKKRDSQPAPTTGPHGRSILLFLRCLFLSFFRTRRAAGTPPFEPREAVSKAPFFMPRVAGGRAFDLSPPHLECHRPPIDFSKFSPSAVELSSVLNVTVGALQL